MPSHIALKLSDFYTIRGRLSRVDFILGIAVSGTIPVILHFVFANIVLKLGNEVFYFVFKSFLHILTLTLATPFYVKRFHDLNTPGYWVLIYWVCLPFTIEFALLLEILSGIRIDPFNEVIVLIGFIGLLVLLLLIFKKGNPDENEWGKPNMRMQPDRQPATPSAGR